MTPSDFLKVHSLLESSGLHDLAGSFLIRASHDVSLPSKSYSIPLSIARQFTLTAPMPIKDHLSSGDNRPPLSLSSSVGRLYTLTPSQRDWFRDRYSFTPTRLVRLAWITAREDDPSVVDCACITSLLGTTDTNRSCLLTSCTFTWAEFAQVKDPVPTDVAPDVETSKPKKVTRASRENFDSIPSNAIDLLFKDLGI